MSHIKALVFACMMILGLQAHAARSGGGGGGLMSGYQLGASLGIVNTAQEHMNTLIQRANTRESGISTPALNSSYEGGVHIGYRFSGSIIGLLLRPSYFYEKTNGSASNGNAFNYGVTGFTIFPMMRLYPLENDLMKFFMQMGLGYGKAMGSIEEAAAKTEFSGDAFGTVVGLGAEFCYAGSHCLALEGNYRFLNVYRNVATSASGTFTGSSSPLPSLSQAQNNKEVEIDEGDLITKMSGIQVFVGYVFYF